MGRIHMVPLMVFMVHTVDSSNVVMSLPSQHSRKNALPKLDTTFRSYGTLLMALQNMRLFLSEIWDRAYVESNLQWLVSTVTAMGTANTDPHYITRFINELFTWFGAEHEQP